MKIVPFIRHYKLEPPFDKKETTSAKQYQDLSTGKIDPDIHPDIRKFLNKHTLPNITNCTLVLSSPAKRTTSTAKAIIDHFNVTPSLKIEPRLREIPWDPSLGPGRVQRFTEDRGENGIESVWARFTQLEKLFADLPDKYVLCMTHSFFIQNAYLYFKNEKKNFRDVSVGDIHESLLARYLEGFSVEV